MPDQNNTVPPDEETAAFHDNDKNARLLQLALNSIDQGFVVWDNDFRLVACNDSFMKLWGYPEELAQPGTPANEFIKFDARTGLHGEGDADAIADKRRIETETRRTNGQDEIFEMKDGRVFYIRRGFVQDLGFLTTFTDITQLKKTEEKLELQKQELIRTNQELETAHDNLQLLNAQKDKFFSIIAHDLKGPFLIFLGYSSLISSNAGNMKPEQMTDAAQTINESALRLNKLLENLLEWSRLQMGRVDYDPALIDVHEIVERSLTLYSAEAESKKIHMTNSLDKPLEIYADPHMVDTIIRNLINNAVKFTSDQGKISIASKKVSDNLIEISVSDTGVGIPHNKLGKLFNLEEKTSTMGTHGEAGSGLGLQLCKEFALKQNGDLIVRSEEGKGSEFRVQLPAI